LVLILSGKISNNPADGVHGFHPLDAVLLAYTVRAGHQFKAGKKSLSDQGGCHDGSICELVQIVEKTRRLL
jgi:hypothetical protein